MSAGSKRQDIALNMNLCDVAIETLYSVVKSHGHTPAILSEAGAELAVFVVSSSVQ
mgnify:CR=1 FL=1